MTRTTARMRVAATRAAKATGLARFARNERGVTAVEFGLVATPFVALIFAILETALVFFGQQTLETATANAARLIRTGQAQQQGFTATQFRQTICDQVLDLFNCNSGLEMDVRTYKTFDEINLAKPVDDTGHLAADDFNYVPGHGTDIVVVRVFYEWPTFSTLLGLNLGNMADGKHLLAATAAFRNEPFPW